MWLPLIYSTSLAFPLMVYLGVIPQPTWNSADKLLQ